jgi:hypothetical protein
MTVPSTTFSPSTIPFKYSEGTWTPQFKYVTSAGAANPLSTITYSKQIGYYTRIGNQVTAYFNIVFTSLGADLYITLVKFFAVGNLPFVFDSPVTSLLISDSASTDFPNGFTGLVPTPVLPVFPASGRTVELVEKDTLVPLYEEQIIGIPHGTWTADGLTMMVRGPVEINIPLFDTYAAEGQIYNHWIASALITYNLSFSGRVTYYTNAAY